MRNTGISILLLALPALANANSVSIAQPTGSIQSLNIRQASSGGHKIYGLDILGAPSEANPLKLSGTFGSVNVEQGGSGASTFAAGVTVTGLGDIDTQLSGAGDHMVTLNAVSASLVSKIDVDTSTASNIDVVVDAAGENVSHDIFIAGYGVDFSLSQSDASSVIGTVTAVGSGSSVDISQSGAGSSLSYDLRMNANSSAVLNQTGSGSVYNINAELGNGATLNVNQLSNLYSGSDLGVVVPDGLTVTITR
ncbi:hypothetical protein B9057_02620 [Aestuarium zhoushanense]|nr:hypothetical protein B9057_02620 [Aestuarium zhoushanense]